MKRIISAEETKSKLEILLDELDDDFSYVIAGLEKCLRDGGEVANSATTIAETLSNDIQNAIEAVADIQGSR